MLKRGLRPIHPGQVLKEMFIAERNLTITEVAKGLNMARANLPSVINGHLGVRTELVVKLSEAFGNTAQFWLNLQKNYELWHAEKKIDRAAIKHFQKVCAKLEIKYCNGIKKAKRSEIQAFQTICNYVAPAGIEPASKV